MAKEKLDGVVEAVHYSPDGKVAWVRAYERRGPTFSDRILLDRKGFIEKLKAGKKFFAGQRIPQEASTFDIFSPIRLIQRDGSEVIVTGDQRTDIDSLAGVPKL
ncbi:MAG: hypothetical protein ACM3PY_20760 [Omnitrophica WOR_2 bacterium]